MSKAKTATANSSETGKARRLEMMPLNAITGADSNPKRHDDVGIGASIGRFGYVEPVVIDERTGRLVAGHGRTQALRVAKAAGATPPQGVEMGDDGVWMVPVLRGWASRSDTEAEAYLLASNQLTQTGGWDNASLGEMLKSLEAQGALEGTGFDEEGIAQVLKDAAAELAKAEGLTDADEVPEVPPEPTTKSGDLYQLGKHRLLCGDSTKAEDVDLLLGGARPHLMVTDPPYGVEYDADWRNSALRSDGTPSDGRAVGKVLNDDRADWREAWALFPGDVAYVWHADIFSMTVADSLIACGFKARALIVWAKSNFAIGRGHYHHKHEPCWYMVRKGGTGHWTGDRSQTTLWDIDKPMKSETGHSTQKPVECMRKPIENNSLPGDLIYEPFSGSGTTFIAAEETSRVCLGMELSPAYCDVIVARWEKFTGQKAVKVTS